LKSTPGHDSPHQPELRVSNPEEPCASLQPHSTSLAIPMSAPVRLNHRVSELFGLSRADAEQFIQNGWVSVDGQVIEAPQHKVTVERVELDPNARLEAVEPATILLHKPAGVAAIYGDKSASALVTPETRWADDPSGERLLRRHFHRLTSPVSMDAKASGLMVLTQDGRVWRRLTEDADLIEQEYVVEISGEIAPDGLRRLSHGLSFNRRALPKPGCASRSRACKTDSCAICARRLD
jgi:23S rRNA pseudouridine2604 synthase